jgi:tetratricopeptide (TPR) repeat protein
LISFERYARIALENKEGKEVLHYANNLLNLCTDSMKFFGYKIEALIILKRIPEAIEFSSKYQNSFIDNPEFLYWRGRILIYNGNTDMGKKYIREALNKDPDNVNF